MFVQWTFKLLGHIMSSFNLDIMWIIEMGKIEEKKIKKKLKEKNFFFKLNNKFKLIKLLLNTIFKFIILCV